MSHLQRYALKELATWYDQSDRQPLVLRGARQVGKSTLVQDFCLNNGHTIVEINLEKTHLYSTKRDQFKVTDLVSELELLAKQKLNSKTVVFFDEIQEDPKLLKYLRYFYEEKPDLPIIAAGSLLEIVLAKEEISFPVGRVQFLNIGPMSFFEFLLALDENELVNRINRLEFSEALHHKALDLFRVFMFVGGMPKVVDAYVKDQSLHRVRDIQNQLLETYKADFPKYGKRINIERLIGVFESAASQLGNKVMYNEIDAHAKSRETRKAIELLKNARILTPCVHCEASGLPLWATEAIDTYKLYFLDIGLVNALHGTDFNTINNQVEQAFISKGYLAEQFVAQHLTYFYGSGISPRLNYWLRDKGSSKGEVDFLVHYKNIIFPLEVKATASGHLKSLLHFTHERKLKRAVKLSTSSYRVKTVSHRFNSEAYEIVLLELPIYAVEAIALALNPLI